MLISWSFWPHDCVRISLGVHTMISDLAYVRTWIYRASFMHGADIVCFLDSIRRYTIAELTHAAATLVISRTYQLARTA